MTEINDTHGVTLIGLLPPEFEMITDYTVAICTQSAVPEQAAVLAQLLCGPASASIRRAGGFEKTGDARA